MDASPCMEGQGYKVLMKDATQWHNETGSREGKREPRRKDKKRGKNVAGFSLQLGFFSSSHHPSILYSLTWTFLVLVIFKMQNAINLFQTWSMKVFYHFSTWKLKSHHQISCQSAPNGNCHAERWVSLWSQKHFDRWKHAISCMKWGIFA